MAKKLLSTYQNWDEVNEAMKRLGELNIQKQKIEQRMTLLMHKIKEAGTTKAGNLMDEIKIIEKDIERFAEQNKEAFAKTRNKKLNFGKISFKATKSVTCKFTESAIKALKTFGLEDCIRVKEELDKDAIKELGKDAEKYLLKAGITIKTTDKISIEPDYIKLANHND